MQRILCVPAMPCGSRMVVDVLPYVMTSTEKAWTREQIEQKVHNLVLTRLGISAECCLTDKRLVEELGMPNGIDT